MDEPHGYVVHITAEPLQDRHGLWCDRCLLPSRIEADIAVMLNGNPGTVMTLSMCDNCEEAKIVST